MINLNLNINGASKRQGFPTANGSGQAFNGRDQYAFVADNGGLCILQATTDFCFSAFVTTSDDITLTQYVFGKGVAASINGRYQLNISLGRFELLFQTSTGKVEIADNITLSTNTEYHITGRIDLSGSKAYFYIDNVLQNAGGTSFTGTFASLANVYEFYLAAGNNADGSGVTAFSKCQLRDVRVYHKDVTSQISELMANKGLGNEVAWWNLPTLTGFGGTTYDLTGVNL